jgi:hypothetical protein
MPRLTNDQRAGIRHAVLADMPPLVDHTEAIRKRIRELSLAKLPPTVKRMAEDHTLAGYLKTGLIYIDGIGSFHIFGDRFATHDPYYEQDSVVEGLVNDHKAAKAARAKADDALRRDLELCTTDAIFRERFPELAKYLPVTPKEIANTLPATTATLDALKAAGWPVEKAA